MEVILGFLLSMWAGLGLPLIESDPDPKSIALNQACTPGPEDRVVWKDLSQPYAEGRYYPANGCAESGPSL